MSEGEPKGADEVLCQRCGIRIIDSPVPASTTFVNYYVPATGFKTRLFLCGEHGRGFREWLAGDL